MGFALGPRAVAASYRLFAHETIGSTNAEALARAAAGDPGRLWVVAKAQTAGHGRRGRPWETPPGNLAASLLLPQIAPARSATLGFAAGLALEEAIRAATRERPPPPWRGRVPLAVTRGAGEGEDRRAKAPESRLRPCAVQEKSLGASRLPLHVEPVAFGYNGATQACRG